MRRTIFLLTGLSLAFADQAGAVTASTAPVGFTRQALEPGLQTVGVTLNHPTVFGGVIAQNIAQSLVLELESPALVGLFANDARYYLEIVAGHRAWIGDRWDIDVARTDAGDGRTLVLAAAAHNTLALPLATNALVGCRVQVKRHLTLADVFGASDDSRCRASTDFAQADQVLFYDRQTGGFLTYFLLCSSDGAIREWRRVGSAANQDATIIPPGAGLFFRRAGADALDWRVTGEVRTNEFVLPLAAGYNFVALPTPVSASPAAMMMTSANGFTAANDAAAADQLLVFNGAGYDAYFLARAADGAAAETWVPASTNLGASSTGELLSPIRSVFIKKLAADPHFVAPAGFGG